MNKTKEMISKMTTYRNFLTIMERQLVMLNLVNRYVVNFFLWWYLVEGKIFFARLFGFWLLALNVLNVLPMLQNLFQPLYQDFTYMGRLIAFPIRSMWILVGGSLLILLIIPILLLSVFYFVMPLIPVWGILAYFFNL